MPRPGTEAPPEWSATLPGGSNWWTVLKDQYGHRCAACGTPGPLTKDHITPRSKGGSSQPHNIQPLCKPCNQTKSARTIDYRPLATAHGGHRP